jgi:8-hydroxy-5-deazaflavin:NADPH oxidoreductase
MTPGLIAQSRRQLIHTGIAIAALILFFTGLPQRSPAQPPPAPADIKIGIIGSGNIGGTLGRLWVKSGHQVLFSSRHPEKLQPLADSLGPLARSGTVREALIFGDAVLIAVPYGAYPQIGKDYARELAGKIVLDAGNAVLRRDGEIANEARQRGIGHTSAKYLSGARIVRAFNTLNFRRLTDHADRSGRRIAIPLAGDDKEALAVASKLVSSAGFDPVIVGSLESARHFAQGGPLYGKEVTAEEMRETIKALR